MEIVSRFSKLMFSFIIILFAVLHAQVSIGDDVESSCQVNINEPQEDVLVSGGSCRVPLDTEVIDLEALRKEQYGELTLDEFLLERTSHEGNFDEFGHPRFDEDDDDTESDLEFEQNDHEDMENEIAFEQNEDDPEEDVEWFDEERQDFFFANEEQDEDEVE
jgi:hypothetical protein